jgi:hypothetical protein
MRKYVRSKIEHEEDNKQELEPLILEGIHQILYKEGTSYIRDYHKKPLTDKEQSFLIYTLHEELQDPEIPDGLVYLYGHILNYVRQNIVYN